MSKTWTQLKKGIKGDYSLYCKTLETGRTLEHNPDRVVEAMSTIKLPILLALLDQAQNQQISLNQRVHISRSQVGRNGTGLLQYMHLTAPLTLYNLAFLMMTLSDNAATNAIIDLLGQNAVNDYIRSTGLTQTRLNLPKLDFPSNYSIRTSPKLALTTPREMARLLELLATLELLDPTHTKIAMRMLRHIQTSTFIRRLPAKSIKQFGSKTGSAGFGSQPHMILNECGFIVNKRGQTHIFSVCSKVPLSRKYPHTVDTTGRVEFARLSANIFDELEAQ